MGVVSNKSTVLSQLLLSHLKGQVKTVQVKNGSKEYKKVILDFGGKVLYQAFKKIVDFCYLDDLNVLNHISDSTELIEIIKLSNQYGLKRLLKAAEGYFQEHMINWLSGSPAGLTLKIQPSSSSESSSQQAKRKNNNELQAPTS
mmetsp:Transcript_41383/g.63078  ORF Transcript_41383/g.63078 Transcript_41383/m.63078 type:complete len:144 (+) Transcript_41383:1648-2079(+)